MKFQWNSKKNKIFEKLTGKNERSDGRDESGEERVERESSDEQAVDELEEIHCFQRF